MTLNLAGYADEIKSFIAETSAGEMEVRFRPNAMTPKLEMELAKAEPGSDVQLRLICRLIAFMDCAPGPLHDEDGTVVLAADEIVPMEPEIIAYVPSAFLSEVVRATMEHMVDERSPKSAAEPVPLKRSEKSSRTGSFSRTG